MKWGHLILVALALGSAVDAQINTRTAPERDFLSYGSPVQYRSYALDPYTPSPVFGWETAQYDRLGQYLMQGRVSMSADEQRPGLSRMDGLNFQQYYEVGAQFDIAVMRDSYMGANYALLILLGNSVKRTEPVTTQLSSLTLNMTRYAGARFDINGPKNRGSFIYSRGAGARRRFSFFTMNQQERMPVILWGGHWETSIGSALKLGSTFVNQHIIDTQSKQGSVLRGGVQHDMNPPFEITVRVVDDSPADPTSPAAAYAMNIIVKGVDEDGNETVITNHPDLAVGGIQLEPSLDPVVDGFMVGSHWEAAGEPGDENEKGMISFLFTMPEGFQSVEAQFVGSVGGDYRVQVSQRHLHEFYDTTQKRDRTRTHVWPTPANGLRYETASYSTGRSLKYPIEFKFPEKDPAYTVLRSDGTPRDIEPREIRFDYGMPTAQTLASINAALDYGGVALDGELAWNTQDFQFPARGGRRNGKDLVSYYVTASRSFDLVEWLDPELGAEIYRIPPDYSGNYDSRRGGAVFFTGVPVTPANTHMTQEFDLFDDNDDRDQWPDEFPDDTGLSEVNDAGVFPGLDENEDSIPDTDQNSNSVPDWDEPFLFFWSDPPAFIYDIDLNNNNLPDLTENDDQPDYPYRRGQKGYHGFVHFAHHLPYVDKVGIGYYRMRQIADSGRSRATYVRFELGARLDGSPAGEIQLKGDVKRVKDSIADDSYIWKTTTDLFANQNVLQRPTGLQALVDLVPPDPDPMLMRNSTVGTLYLDTDLDLTPRLNTRLRYKYHINRQAEDEFADGSRQDEGTLSRINLSTRLEYHRPVGGRIDLFGRAKHLYWRDGGVPKPARQHWSTLGPFFEGTLALTERAALVFGQEGVPYLLPLMHHDLEDAAGDFDRWTSVFMLRTNTDYVGWQIVTEIGLQNQRVDEGDRDFSNRAFFVEMFFGW